MENCLKTQLKATVSNSNLEKLGEFKFGISGTNTFQGAATEVTELKISDDYPNVTFSNGQRTMNLGTGTTTVTTSAACDVILTNKYNLLRVNSNANAKFKCDIDKLQYSPMTVLTMYSGSPSGANGEITGHTSKIPTSIETVVLYSDHILYDGFPSFPSLKLYDSVFSEPVDINEIADKCPVIETIGGFRGNIKGNIETLPAKATMKTLRFENRTAALHNEVTGNIASLGTWRALETLNISDSKISGNISDFLDAMYNSGSGRTSGSITITVNNIVTNVSGAATTQVYNFSAGGWAMAE